MLVHGSHPLIKILCTQVPLRVAAVQARLVICSPILLGVILSKNGRHYEYPEDQLKSSENQGRHESAKFCDRREVGQTYRQIYMEETSKDVIQRPTLYPRVVVSCNGKSSLFWKG